MKHPYLLALFLFVTQVIGAQKGQPLYSDSKLNHLSKQLIGFSLFEGGIASRLDSIIASPHFTVDTLIKQTDTSSFYFRGYWSQFNPFGIEMDSVRLIVAELKRKNRITKETVDTVFYFQTEGSLLAPLTDKELHQAFTSLHKKLKSAFTRSHYGKDKTKQLFKAEWYRYYKDNSLDWAASIIWNKRSKNWTTFTITFVTKLK